MKEAQRILFLGERQSSLAHWLVDIGEHVTQLSEKVTPTFIMENRIEFVVSCGYRHLIKKNILDILPQKVINLHISYLPWNRGADPNFWSFVDATPKGVTIHYVDEGIDTGDIIVQEKIEFHLDEETLATSYEELQRRMCVLFQQHWGSIKSGHCERKKQVGVGSAHRMKDKEKLFASLPDAWDTSLSFLNRIRDIDEWLQH